MDHTAKTVSCHVELHDQRCYDGCCGEIVAYVKSPRTGKVLAVPSYCLTREQLRALPAVDGTDGGRDRGLPRRAGGAALFTVGDLRRLLAVPEAEIL